MDRELDSSCYSERSNRFFGYGTNGRSIVLSKRSLTIKSDCYEAHYLWAKALFKNQENEKAVKKFRELHIVNPEDSRIYFHLGELFERQNNLVEAETQYKKRLSLYQFDDSTMEKLIMVLASQCKYKEALEQAEKKVEMCPSDSSGLNNLGYLKFTLGDYKEALKNFETAIEKGTQSGLPLMNRILTLYCLGSVEMAGKVFEAKFEKVRTTYSHKILEDSLRIYMQELGRFEEILKSDDLREMDKKILRKNIKGFRFIINRIKLNICKQSINRYGFLQYLSFVFSKHFLYESFLQKMSV